MNSRFSDQLIARAPGASPTHAVTLLRSLGVGDSERGVQRTAVQRWLDEGHEVPWLLERSLAERALPTTKTSPATRQAV